MFEGFSPKTIDFMWGIRFNNEKAWFEANKEDYLNYFYNPMKELNAEVYEALNDAYPDLGLSRKVSRIYRDARRLRGRGPYKDRLWMSVERPSEEWTAQPVFWFELEPEGYSYGMGYYLAKALTMAKLRARLDSRPQDFEPMAKKFAAQDRFLFESDSYKKPKGDPGPLLRDWYNSKGFSLIHFEKHDSLLYSRDLVSMLVESYRFLMPYYQYFMSLDSDPDPRG